MGSTTGWAAPADGLGAGQNKRVLEKKKREREESSHSQHSLSLCFLLGHEIKSFPPPKALVATFLL